MISHNKHKSHKLDMNSTVQRLNSLVALPTNSVKSLNVNSFSSPTTLNTPLVWFFGVLVVALIFFYLYYREVITIFNNFSDQVNLWLTGYGTPPEIKQENIPVAPPVPPQDELNVERTGMSKVVENILPPAKEVFTVSKNDYSYYDAAPLCKALGAELATYDQVKTAWQKGADWCNYGWVKGQMAVYPTQKGTYEELQQGPDDQKGACGKPGLNGGYFDNPELKFGVTCVGKRPSQSQHDANAISAGATRPLTASGLEFDKKVQYFKEESETLGILPFNKEHWSS
jgi:hypothetical protein